MAKQEIIWNYETAKEFITFWGHDPSLEHSAALSRFKKHKEGPLFTTMDGKEIFNGDIFYSLEENGMPVKRTAIPSMPNYPFTFSAIGAAHEFHEQSKRFGPPEQTFEQVVEPVIKWLATNKNPHYIVLVTNARADLVVAMEGFGNDKYIKP